MRNSQTNNSEKSAPLMGLSEVSILHEKSNVFTETGFVILKKVGRSINAYKQQHARKAKEDVTEAQLIALRGERFKGDMTTTTRRRMFQVIENWQSTLEYQYISSTDDLKVAHREIILITLTLAEKQTLSDKDCKRRLLGQFLKSMIYNSPSTRYLWKAETQDNGNIHFHILVDNYFDKEWVRLTWNNILTNNGIHTFENYTDTHLGAPSTRIEGLRDKGDAFAYIAKYISKTGGARLIEGRVWGCSDSLRNLNNIAVTLPVQEALALINNNITAVSSIYNDDYCTIIKRTTISVNDFLHSSASSDFFAVMQANILILNSQFDKTYKAIDKGGLVEMILNSIE